MRNGHCENLRVKHLAIYQLLPKLVNLTTPFIKFEHSDQFLKMIRRSSRVKWGTGKLKKIEKEKHVLPFINLNKDFIKTGGLVLSSNINELENFDKVIRSIPINYAHTVGSSE